MSSNTSRDVEKEYSKVKFVAKLRRLADAIEQGERFEIQIAGERIYVPVRAEFTIEHEKVRQRRRGRVPDQVEPGVMQ